MPVCFGCKSQIAPSTPSAAYENNTYHPDCLKCAKCKRSVCGKQFMKGKNGELICEECNAKDAPKCHKCHKAFGPGQPYKKANENTFYHNECFVCASRCRKPISGEFYDMEDGRFICTECYDQYGDDDDNTSTDLSVNFDAKINLSNSANPSNVQVLPAVQRGANNSNNKNATTAAPTNNLICAGCNQKLKGSYTVYADNKYHPECFKCVQCKNEFKEKTFFKLDDKPLCRDCHNKNQNDKAVKCKKCHRPIVDTVVTFKGGEFHDTCLVCGSCGMKLVGQSIYTDKQENPFCVDCFTKKEAKTCAKCQRPIAPNQTNLVFEEMNFHKECFTCKECFRLISSSESFYKSDDNSNEIICSDCINKQNSGSSF
jgi:ribosomal protein L40E